MNRSYPPCLERLELAGWSLYMVYCGCHQGELPECALVKMGVLICIIDRLLLEMLAPALQGLEGGDWGAAEGEAGLIEED